ncbi:ABC transporter permease [Weissella minor]|uniref:ABC transporter permease n=1 Tax=Weissella minor TaxID=1620 RepID=UPI001BAF0841|nr:ABC transporter permease [Weissella minor]MBS0950081.1 ABC transporter permease [Weissella minor]
MRKKLKVKENVGNGGLLKRTMIREFKKDSLARYSLYTLIGILLVVFIGALFIPKASYLDVNIIDQYLAPMTEGHILGTDNGGHDIIAMLLVSARNSLVIALAVTFITFVFGTILGTITAYYGGKVDMIIMRMTDFIMILPVLMIIIVLVTIVPKYNAGTLIILMSAFYWIGTMRLVRSRVLTESQRDYVKASKTSGTSDIKIMFREILPNITSLLIAEATLSFAGNIGLETGLSFLGFGLPAGTPSLGTMINEATNPETMTAMPWTWVPAAIVILIVVLSIIFVGQALRRVADQRQSV